ncbi:MAG: hypothetical protein FVQ79_07695 [Planctomycetes bacterium]|nr:hypothetical protein [Planctomycetota bacterium]
MNAIFSSPGFLTALAAVPVLCAIYLLRNKFRTFEVSSLMLWDVSKKSRQGGLKLRRIETPLLFLIELLVILLLVHAAAGLMLRSKKDTSVVVVVLDDSFSMLAGNDTSPRDRAAGAIIEFLNDSGRFDARFILASQSCRLLGNSVTTTAQASELLRSWTCMSPSADLDRAITFAAELAPKAARLLIITDHKPDESPEKGRLEWWSFGRAIPNTGFVNAARTNLDDKSRCFWAIANLSPRPAGTTLVAVALQSGVEVMRKNILLDPGQVTRMIVNVDANVGPLKVTLDADGLTVDDQIILLPSTQRKVRVKVRIDDEKIRSLVVKAIETSSVGTVTSIAPEIVIGEKGKATAASQGCWKVEIVSDPNAAAYVGPFVMNRSHPLTEGLSLDGVIWGASKRSAFIGQTIIAAGNVPLITDRQLPDKTHNLKIYLNTEFSNIQSSTNWPVLMWNLLNWRTSDFKGLSRSNYTLGQPVIFQPKDQTAHLTLTHPDGKTKDIEAQTQRLMFGDLQPGLYRIDEKNEKTHLFAVNAMSNSESDLTAAMTGKWGRWQEASLFWWQWRPLDWILLLTALMLLSVHRVLTATNSRGAQI